MTLKTLIDLGDIKEKQAFALTGYLADKIDVDKLDIETLQNAVDSYCDNLAHSFISEHKDDLKDKHLLLGLRNHILSIRADKPHSGYRFYEALYKKLNDFEKIISNNLIEQIL